MYIKFLDYKTIDYLKKYRDELTDWLQTKSFDEILDDKLGIPWFVDSKIINPNINFVIRTQGRPKDTDIDNAICIYESLKNLTESQASDERLWAGYAIDSKSYNYLKFRWPDIKKTLRYRITYDVPGKRGMMYHGLARLWWFAHLTFDETYEDPYELTRFCFNYPHILEKMLYRNYSNSQSVRIGIIEGIRRFINKGGNYATTKMDLLFNHISIISGVHLLDFISKEEISDLVEKELFTYE